MIRTDLAVVNERFNVEVDDVLWHADPIALQRDHAREVLLMADDWTVVCVTTEDIHQRLRATAATVGDIYHRRKLRRGCGRETVLGPARGTPAVTPTRTT